MNVFSIQCTCPKDDSASNYVEAKFKELNMVIDRNNTLVTMENNCVEVECDDCGYHTVAQMTVLIQHWDVEQAYVITRAQSTEA